jgi:hypothetical protein
MRDDPNLCPQTIARFLPRSGFVQQAISHPIRPAQSDQRIPRFSYLSINGVRGSFAGLLVNLRQVDGKRAYRRSAGSHDPEVVMIEAVVPIKAD